MERKVNIIFEPVAHTYKDETGLQYTSVTTVIDKYKEPFNKKYWGMYTALKNEGYNVRPEDSFKGIYINNKFRSLDSLYKNPINTFIVNNLYKKWKEDTIKACDRGNEVHDYLEDSINLSKGDIKGETNEAIKPNLTSTLSTAGLEVVLKCVHDLDKTSIKDRYPEIYDTLKAYIDQGCTIYAEKRIYSTTYQIAGMIDVLIIKGKQFAILDWKTNKDKMHFISGYYKKVKVKGKWIKSTNYITTGKRLKYPINTLEDCKGMIYSMQLSLYAYIMELWGYTLVKGGLKIYHIRPNLRPKLLQISYKKEEVKKMLQHHSNKNKGINFEIQ